LTNFVFSILTQQIDQEREGSHLLKVRMKSGGNLSQNLSIEKYLFNQEKFIIRSGFVSRDHVFMKYGGKEKK
jgi:hypothetical protein